MADGGKFVYGLSEGSGGMKDLLGGKGAGLAEMCRLGLPVPPGFTLTTEACRAYTGVGELPAGLMESVTEHLRDLEEVTGKRLGDSADPLLVSVRSGAAVSMPGMMDTVLNLGLNDAAVVGLARRTGDERFAYDSYRRFIQMFGDIVLKVPRERFEEALEAAKEKHGVEEDSQLNAADLRELVGVYKGIVEAEAERPFPEDPGGQLELAIRAVFDSWDNDRAVAYRREFGIPGTWAPPSRCRPGSSATWVKPRPRGWPSRAIRPRESRGSSGSSCSTPRARTSWRAYARLGRWRR